MITCLSPNGSTTYFGPSLPDTLVVATVEGVLTARHRNDQWEVQSHELRDHHVASAVYEPVSGVVFVCSYGGGIYMSDDGGMTWQSIGEELAGKKLYTLGARSVGSQVTLFAGTEPVGLFTSGDYGASWSELPGINEVPNTDTWTFPAPPHRAHLKSITFDPADDHGFYVSVEQGGLFHTTDDGSSFHELESLELDDEAAGKDIHRLVIDAAEPERFFVAAGDGLLTSEDRGASWRRIHGRSWTIGYPDALVIDPRDSALIYLAGATSGPGSWRQVHTADAHVARSRDHGESWEIVDQGLPSPLRGNIEAMSLSCSPEGSRLYVGTTDGEVYESAAEGDHWQLALKGLAPVSKGGHWLNLAQH